MVSRSASWVIRPPTAQVEVRSGRVSAPAAQLHAIQLDCGARHLFHLLGTVVDSARPVINRVEPNP